jgi:hypothetical protein
MHLLQSVGSKPRSVELVWALARLPKVVREGSECLVEIPTFQGPGTSAALLHIYENVWQTGFVLASMGVRLANILIVRARS